MAETNGDSPIVENAVPSTRDELVKALQEQEREAMRLCTDEINAALEKHKFELYCEPRFANAGGLWAIDTSRIGLRRLLR